MITEVPSFYDYMAYMYFCGAAISGPWYEYKDLYDFMRAQGHYENIHKVKTFKASMIKFCTVWLCVIVGSIIGDFGFDLSQLTSAEFASYSLPW